MTLDQYIQQLERAGEQLKADNVRRLMAAIEDLKDYGQSIGHEKTGQMDETMHVEGPLEESDGVVEVLFESDVPYAEEEVARGGTHDWATRTLNERRDRIFELQTEVEHALVAALTGGKG